MFNLTGAIIVTLTSLILSVYLVSTFTVSKLADWFAPLTAWCRGMLERWRERRAQKRRLKVERAKARAAERLAGLREAREAERRRKEAEAELKTEAAPWDAPQTPAAPEPDPEPVAEDIPICPIEEFEPAPPPSAPSAPMGPRLVAAAKTAAHPVFQLPPTDLLNEPQGRSPYDEQELKDIAIRVKAKFEEFNVLGSVVQINPGPVVTPFEFKPDAGIKYSRIITLTEDLCLGLQAESILIERIPGKPTVGIEVPNSKRELIIL